MNQNDDLLREQILNPKSEGEKNQVEQIKKFSEDPEEIIRFRKDLQKVKESYSQHQNDTEDSDSKSNAGRRQIQLTPKRRRYDLPVIEEKKASFFHVFFNLFSLLRLFKGKYKNSTMVDFSFVNFLSNGSFFSPSRNVALFVQKEIIPLQEMMRPFLRNVYQYGWRDKKGKKILDPYSFNLLAEFERLQNKNHVEDFLQYLNQPAKAMEKLNYFLGYYFSITETQADEHSLLNSLKIVITRMVSDDETALSGKNAKLLLKLAEEFISLPIKEKMITPLLESYLARPLDIGDIEQLIKFKSISTTEYYADPQLKARMKILEEKYKKYLEEKKEKTTNLVNNVYALAKALEFRRDHNGNKVLLVDYAASKKRNMIKGLMESLDLFSHQKPFLTVEFFFDVYFPLIQSSITVKKDFRERRTMEISFFASDVFSEEFHNIDSSRDYLRKFAEKFQTKENIFETSLNDLTEEQNYQIIVINNVADQFYSIGSKLIKYFSAQIPENQMTEEVITETNLGKRRSIFESYFLHGLPHKKDFQTEYDFFQKTMYEILQEIQAFCFQYAYSYEHQQRQFKSSDSRQKTFKNLLAEKNKLETELEALKKGEEID